MTETEAHAVLLAAILQAGSQKRFAELHGLHRTFVNDLVFKRRNLTTKVLDILGLERIVSYRKKTEEAPHA